MQPNFRGSNNAIKRWDKDKYISASIHLAIQLVCGIIIADSVLGRRRARPESRRSPFQSAGI